jgi:two-component system, OmpR family, sensor histidine kinase SenX3
VRIARPTATRVAFAVIVVFVLAQVTWWIIVQGRLALELRDTTLAAWERDARVASELLAIDPAREASLLARYPHLRSVPGPDGPAFAVDPGARAAVEARSDAIRRMLAFEGPFFALVILGLLLFIASSLRSERELKRRQANFLSAVTHEFKTPISTLRLLVQTLRLRTLPPERQQDYLRRMEAEVDRLERTSDQVLATARLEQANEPAPLAAAELNHVVQGVMGRLRSGLELRGAQLRVHYSPEPLPVALDADAFGVALSNLLDNAVKYTPGAVKPVTVTTARDGDLVFVHVDDEGVGLAPEERQRVFERFYRTGDEMTRESAGVGLGLALVKSTIEAMRGWVKVAAGPKGRGTRFTVVLPRRVALDEDATATGDATSGSERGAGTDPAPPPVASSPGAVAAPTRGQEADPVRGGSAA